MGWSPIRPPPVGTNSIAENIPLDKDGNLDKDLQQTYIGYYLKINKLKDQMISTFFEKMNEFEKAINNQLSAKMKEYFLAID